MADAAPAEVRKAGGWVMVWGVLMIIAGILAILEPPIAALAAELLIAWLFVFVGIVQIMYAIQNRSAPGFRLHILSAILALLLGGFLLANGVSEVMHAFRLKPNKGWGWVLLDGLLSIVIAFLIASGWPQSSIAFIGVLVGVMMIYGGIWRILLGSALRNAPSPAAASART
jgi:uncharacterized membrane protein HdeD (DUF308 family)